MPVAPFGAMLIIILTMESYGIRESLSSPSSRSSLPYSLWQFLYLLIPSFR